MHRMARVARMRRVARRELALNLLHYSSTLLTCPKFAIPLHMAQAE
jgi:hypothetical protein